MNDDMKLKALIQPPQRQKQRLSGAEVIDNPKKDRVTERKRKRSEREREK